jgi:hypothetical protein
MSKAEQMYRGSLVLVCRHTRCQCEKEAQEPRVLLRVAEPC